MSTTSDLKTALQYSLSESSVLFHIVARSFVQRGANLQFLSAFPSEQEFLYRPLTFLRPTGRVVEIEISNADVQELHDTTVKYVVVEVEPFNG